MPELEENPYEALLDYMNKSEENAQAVEAVIKDRANNGLPI